MLGSSHGLVAPPRRVAGAFRSGRPAVGRSVTRGALVAGLLAVPMIAHGLFNLNSIVWILVLPPEFFQ